MTHELVQVFVGWLILLAIPALVLIVAHYRARLWAWARRRQ